MKVYFRLIRWMGIVSAWLVVVVMAAIAADVSSRVFFGRSVGWVFELTEHSMVALLALGMPWVAHRHGHVRIEVFVESAPNSLRRAISRLAFFVAGIAGLVAAGGALRMAWFDLAGNTWTSGFYPIPRSAVAGLIGLGFLLTAIEFFRISWSLGEIVDRPVGEAGSGGYAELEAGRPGGR